MIKKLVRNVKPITGDMPSNITYEKDDAEKIIIQNTEKNSLDSKILNSVKLVKNIKPIEKINFKGNCYSKNIVLYKNFTIIQAIRDQVMADYLGGSSNLETFQRILLGNFLGVSEKESEGILSVDEISLKPASQFNWIFELGTDFEFKWNTENKKNVNIMIQSLFSAMYKKRLGITNILEKVRMQNPNTKSENLIFPGMPIFLLGAINDKGDLHSDHVVMHEIDRDDCIKIFFNKDQKLSQSIYFIKKRLLNVIGMVEDIENGVTVQAGAIILV